MFREQNQTGLKLFRRTMDDWISIHSLISKHSTNRSGFSESFQRPRVEKLFAQSRFVLIREKEFAPTESIVMNGETFVLNPNSPVR
jgi:hypothetical protein